MNNTSVTLEECIKLIEAHLESNVPKGTPLVLTDNYWKVVLKTLRKYKELHEKCEDEDRIIWDDLPKLKVGDVFKRKRDNNGNIALMTVVSVIDEAAGEYAVTVKNPDYAFTYRPKEDPELEMIFRMEREAEFLKNGHRYAPTVVIWDAYHSSGRGREGQ